MVYTVYKVTNVMNRKFYIGVHKTNNPYDNYFGSGEQIKAAIKKYGKSNFVKEILFTEETADAAYAREAEIVNEDFIKSPMTYNMYVGGFGKGIEVANALGLNNKGKTKEHWERMRSARKPNTKHYTDQQLIDVFNEIKSVRLACLKLGGGVSGGLSRRMRSVLDGVGIEHKSKSGPKKR